MENLKIIDRDSFKIDGFKIMISLFEKYKNEPWVLSQEEIERKKKSFFGGKWGSQIPHDFRDKPHKFGLKSGIVYGNHLTGEVIYILVGYNRINEILRREKFDCLKKIKQYFRVHDSKNIMIPINYKRLLTMSEPEVKFIQEFLDKVSNQVDKEIEEIENRKKRIRKRENDRISDLKKLKKSLIDDLDKNRNGIIDVIEGGDDFDKLFKKNQKKIIENDKTHIQQFVKISKYLRTKKNNLQETFELIRSSPDKESLKDLIGMLKNQIHTYELIVFNSISMVVSLIEDDLITFYEIYELFDELKMFNSTWENEVSDKLNDIGDGLSELMFSINKMERNIVNEIGNLTYVTQESFKSLESSVTKELNSIDSSIKFNNLLTGIQTYQMYKINKNTKSLRS